uniref:Uncharacterized protein n=1 Tax=Daphnia magna TaxID=35525 RepID=A0A0P5SGH8_9CRUS
MADSFLDIVYYHRHLNGRVTICIDAVDSVCVLCKSLKVVVIVVLFRVQHSGSGCVLIRTCEPARKRIRIVKSLSLLFRFIWQLI